MKTIYFDNI